MRKIRIIGLLICFLAIGAFLAAPVAAAPQGAPAKMKVGFIDFFSGGGAVFGISGKWTTEVLVDIFNKKGGIRGVPIDVILVDENGPTAKTVTEFRRLVLEEKVEAIVGITSSGITLTLHCTGDNFYDKCHDYRNYGGHSVSQ